MTTHDRPLPSTCVKSKTCKAMRKPDAYIPACSWACASAALNLSVSSACSAASGAVRCSCRTISTRQKNCKEALLRVGFTHPRPTANSLQFRNFVFELLNLKQGQNLPNVTRLFETESVVKLVSCCTIAPVIACLLCGSYTQVSWCNQIGWTVS